VIREKIGENYAGLNIQFVEAKRWKKGNLYSLLAAQEIFQQNFLLCMCDHIFDAEIPKSKDIRRGPHSPHETKRVARPIQGAQKPKFKTLKRKFI